MDRVIDAVGDLAFAPPLKVRRSRMGFIMDTSIMVILSLPLPALYVVLVLGMAFSARRKEWNWREPEFEKAGRVGGNQF
jgi:Fe2+ transport system protein FeoA